MARRGCSSPVVLAAALATLLFQVTAAEPKNEEDIGDVLRISGGQETSSTQFPWQVYVLTKRTRGKGVCGGSIISTTWVMSAIHCFTTDINDHEFEVDVAILRIYLYAGLTEKSKRGSDPDVQLNIIIKEEFDDHLFNHPDYKKGTKYNNDITLIKLKKQFTLTDQVQPIALATSDDFFPGKKLTASGWGITSTNGKTSNILLYVDRLNLLSREECADIWGSHLFTENMICHRTDGRGSCKGDSGGPVVTGSGNSNGPPYVQIGIVSWGYCENKHYPDVFVDVAKYRGWISHIMSGIKCSDEYSESDCTAYAALGLCERVKDDCKKTCNKCLG